MPELKYKGQVIGQIIEIDPAKFYILELKAGVVGPAQADNIREQLHMQGVKMGIVVGTATGRALKVKETQTDER